MDGLAAATAVTSLNGVHDLEALFRGGQTEVELANWCLGEKEAVVAVARLLARSEGSLTRLDLR